MTIKRLLLVLSAVALVLVIRTIAQETSDLGEEDTTTTATTSGGDEETTTTEDKPLKSSKDDQKEESSKEEDKPQKLAKEETTTEEPTTEEPKEDKPLQASGEETTTTEEPKEEKKEEKKKDKKKDKEDKPLQASKEGDKKKHKKKKDKPLKEEPPKNPPTGNQIHTDDKFQQSCLRAHNGYRHLHGATPLKVDKKTTEIAKKYVQIYKLTTTESEQYAVNHFGATSVQAMPECGEAVKQWYNGISAYNFKKPGFSPKAGGFTQVVWKATKWLGCARRAVDLGLEKVGSKKVRIWNVNITCAYSEPGNVLDEFQGNVKPKGN